MKQLTTEQIDALFVFTKKHYVEFYDVQVELVDHLANAIEEQWKENQKLSFDEALQTEFKKFGIFGFTGLVEQKQAELHKYYNKMLWNEMRSFISIPKVVVTLALYLGVYFFIKNTNEIGEMFALGILISSLLFFLFDGLRFIFKVKKEQKKQGRSWLIQSVAQSIFSFPMIGISGGYFSIINSFFSNEFGISNVGLHFLSFFIVFQLLSMFVFYQVIKPSFTKSIQETERRYQLI